MAWRMVLAQKPVVLLQKTSPQEKGKRMEVKGVPVVQNAQSLTEAIDQFTTFAEGWDAPLKLVVANVLSYAKENGTSDEDVLDEIIWNFKLHAPQGWSLDATTGQTWRANYTWYPTHMLLDCLLSSSPTRDRNRLGGPRAE